MGIPISVGLFPSLLSYRVIVLVLVESHILFHLVVPLTEAGLLRPLLLLLRPRPLRLLRFLGQIRTL